MQVKQPGIRQEITLKKLQGSKQERMPVKYQRIRLESIQNVARNQGGKYARYVAWNQESKYTIKVKMKEAKV